MKNSDLGRIGSGLSFSALVFGVLCVCFSIHADIMRVVSRWNVAAALVTGALGGVAAQGAGKCLRGHDGFCMWQPFRGGLSFVLLQYFGWLFYGVSMMMFAVLLYSHDRIVRKSGTISSVGLLASASVLTLITSIAKFQPRAETWLDQLHLIKRDNLVVIACAVSGLVFSVLVELKYEKLEQYHYGLRASILALMAVAGFLVLVIGKHRYRGKKIFHPFQGGFYFVLMQSSGWAGFGVGTSLFATVAFDDDVLPGILFSVTFLVSASLVLLVLSLDCFHEVETTRLLRKLRLTREMVGCVMIGLLATATNVLLDLAWRPQSFLSIFSVACHVLVAPSLHVFASRIHSSYHLWQPFCGGPRFIVLQGIGWTLFAISHVICVLAVINNVRLLVGASSFFVFLSDAVICLSLTFFVPESATETISGAPRSPLRRGSRPGDNLMNGEIVTSLMMIIGGAISLITVDWYPVPSVFSTWQICLCAMVLMLLSYVVAQLSGRKMYRNYPMIRPFHGGPDHVALQTVGWTIWGTLVALFSVLEINLAVGPDHVPQGSITACTLLAVFGYCILAASIPLYREEESEDGSLPQQGGRHRSAARLTLAELRSNEDRDRWIAAAQEASRLLPLLHSPELRQVLNALVDEVGSAALTQISPPRRKTDEGLGAMSLSVVLSSGALVVLVICEIFSILLDVLRRGAVIGPLAVCASTASVMSWLLTHGVAGQRRYPASYRWWMPFTGGFNFALMQTVAWGFCSMHLATLSVILYSLHVGIQPYLGSYMVLGFFGFTCHVLLVMSLSHFEPLALTMQHETGSTSFLARNSEWFVGSLLTIFALSTLAAADGVFLSGTKVLPVAPVIFCGTFALALAVPLGWISVMKSRSSPIVPVGSAATYHLSLVTEVFACTVIAVWLVQRMISSWGDRWYVSCICVAAVVHHVGLLLTIVWNEQHSLYVLALELVAEFVTFAIYSFHYVVVGVFVYIGFFVHLSYASIAFFAAVNLLSFNSPLAVRTVQVFTAAVLVVEGCRGAWGPVCFLCPVLLYSTLYRSESLWDRTRHSKWAASRATFFWECAARYFSYRVIVDEKAVEGARLRQPVLYGFHPHGVCPYTSMWGTHCHQWKVTGLPIPVVHASSFLLSVPVVRDLMLLLGVVDCSVAALRHTLHSGNCGLVVPGGMQEALQQYPPTEQVTLVVKNKGLFRVALQQGVGLVPVFCFGEADIISGIPLPSFQFWAKRKLGITYPQLPHGRLLLPLPRRRPVTVVVGESIFVEKVAYPTPADIDRLHREYYDKLGQLFDRHKASLGFPEAQLVFADSN